MPLTQSILPRPSGRRCRQIITALAALVALVTVTSTAQARTTKHHGTSVMHSARVHAKKGTTPAAPARNAYAGFANYAAGYLTNGNTVPQGGNRYDSGFAGWTDFASGYTASHPAG